MTAYGQTMKKKLALVIGNSEYIEGKLKNPVNDALLMKKTLESLDFEVLIDTNISSRNSFLQTIDIFLNKRPNYEICFVYYAGHAIQIDGTNFLLATDERYQTTRDVKYNGIDVNIFLDEYNIDKSHKVNILVLDACRNNPFEKNWAVASRSLPSGKGLAEMSNPPSGTLIAFSTQGGATASDGEGSNSIYCESLARNLLVQGTRLEDVFAKVRKEVRILSENRQIPTCFNDLEGNACYLNPNTYTQYINEIDSLIDIRNFIDAKLKTSALLALDSKNKTGLLRAGLIEFYESTNTYDGEHIFLANQIYPNDPEVHLYIARYYRIKKEYSKALTEINAAISLNPSESDIYFWKAKILEETNAISEAEKAYNLALEFSENKSAIYLARSNFYHEYLNNNTQALHDINQALIISPNNIEYLCRKGDFLSESGFTEAAKQEYTKAILGNPESSENWTKRGQMELVLDNYSQAISDFKEALRIEPTNASTIYYLTKAYKNSGNHKEAISTLDKTIENFRSKNINSTFAYELLAEIYIEEKDYYKALDVLNQAIIQDKNNEKLYIQRADLYSLHLEDNNSAMKDYDNAVQISPTNIETLKNRAVFLIFYFDQPDAAIKDLQQIVQSDSNNIEIFNLLGIAYEQLNNYQNANYYYSKGIEISYVDSASASFCYRNRGELKAKNNKFSEALKDYGAAIELNPTNEQLYIARGNFHLEYPKDIKSAESDYTKAIKMRPDIIDTHGARGYFYFNNEEFEKAIIDFKSILSLDSCYINGIIQLGESYESIGKFDYADSLYSNALSYPCLTPVEKGYICGIKGKLATIKNQYNEAIICYSDAIKYDPENSVYYYLRGDLYNDFMKQPYSAFVDYSLAINADSLDEYSIFRRGLIFSDILNDHNRAIQEFKKIIKIDSTDVTSINWIGVFFDRLLMEDSALVYYNKTICQEGKSFEDSLHSYQNGICWAFNNLAETVQAEGNLDLANYYFNQAIKYDSSTAERYYRRAFFYARFKNDLSKAISDLNKAIELDPKSPLWRIKIAQLQVQDKNYRDAKKSYDKAIELCDDDALKTNYIAERGRFHSIVGNYDQAMEDFNLAIRKDSANKHTYNLITEHFLRIKDYSSAEKSSNMTLEKFANDTVSFFQLGTCYFEQSKYLNSLDAFLKSACIMEFNYEYNTIDAEDEKIYLSDNYHKIALIYESLKENDLALRYYEKAIETLKNENRPNRNELKQTLTNQIQRINHN
jgi:tetratricopeptide (TPR) repeat protein